MFAVVLGLFGFLLGCGLVAYAVLLVWIVCLFCLFVCCLVYLRLWLLLVQLAVVVVWV